MQIDQTSLVKEAQATLAEAEANLERARSLVEKRLIARAEFDTANATYLRAETAVENAREEIRNRLALLRQRRSELELAKKQLADTTIRSPLAGVVEARQANLGEYLSVGAPIATIVRIDPLRLRAEVPERECTTRPLSTSRQGMMRRASPMFSRFRRRAAARRRNPACLRRSRGR